MHILQKFGILMIATAVPIAMLLSPRFSHGQDGASVDIGNYIVRYSVVSTNQLLPAMAQRYGITRDINRGLLNIAVQEKGPGAHMVRADVSARAGDLLGHGQPVRFRETSEGGEIDYLGVFDLNGSGTYRFSVRVVPPGATQPHVVEFNRDFVVD
ncbi:MAG TPA: DUF4426 domain-containing protein [Rudaea sp.]|nr:DUF4426 domain-containing protein [Rudaea sp.]